MDKMILIRTLLVLALVVSVPGSVLAQDDDLAPRSLQALALQFEVQQEQIDRLHQRIDDIRISTVRDRIKALESAVAALGGQFAALPFSVVSSQDSPHDRRTCRGGSRMTTKMLTRLAIAVAMAISLPSVAAAQTEANAPEGTTWHLVSYTLDGATETVPVPWTVDASLLLEDGTASGSSGCNTFNGTYSLDGEQLTFEPAFAVTRIACPEPQTSVENAYLLRLPETAMWQVTDGVLTLSDGLGDPVLEFEPAVLALTESDLAAIAVQFAEQQAEIARAGKRIDSIRIGALRDRIKELERTVKSLEAQAAAASSSSSSTPAYDAQEKVLLKAIPRKVARTCRPLRSSLPSGTVAALACDGSRNNVAEQAYYLMEWQDAVTTMKSVASANGAPNRPRGACFSNKPGWLDAGPSVGAEACWIDGGRANYRLITRAAGCQQLDVAGTHLTEPAIYLAMEAKNNRVEPLRAAGLAYTDSNYYIMNFEAGGYIPAGSQPKTPGCRAHTDVVG